MEPSPHPLLTQVAQLSPAQHLGQAVKNEHTLLELEVKEYLDHRDKGLIMGYECYIIEHELNLKAEALAEQVVPHLPASADEGSAEVEQSEADSSPSDWVPSEEVDENPSTRRTLPPAEERTAGLPEAEAPAQERLTVEHILFMGASPVDRPRVRLGLQVREISESLARARMRDRFDFMYQIAVTPQLFQRHLLDLVVVPRYLHFAGFGVDNDPTFGSGLVLENDEGETTVVPQASLPELFKLFQPVDCILFNAPQTASTARAVAQVVEFVIGIDGEWPDQAAIEFATGFYDALGAGRSIQEAVEFGRSALRLTGWSDADELAQLPFLLAQA